LGHSPATVADRPTADGRKNPILVFLADDRKPTGSFLTLASGPLYWKPVASASLFPGFWVWKLLMPVASSRIPSDVVVGMPSKSPGIGCCVVALVLWSAVVNFGYWLAGVRFDVSPLTYFWQFLDPELLRHDLLRSLYYLHSQPPLYNLFVGIVLKAAPEHYAAVFHAVHLLIGLVFESCIFWLLVRLDVGRITATVMAALFVATPDFILYENVLFYSFMVAALVTLSAVFLFEFLRSRQTWAAAGFFVVLFLICGIRSLFHLGFFLLLVPVLALACRAQWRKVVLCAAIPGILLTSIYVKNYLVFGQFTASTWFGLNAWTMTTRNLADEDRKELVRRGVLTPISLIDREAPLEDFPATYRDASAFPQVPVLVAPRKSTGAVNMNHAGYIAICKAYGKDALAGLIHRPRSFLVGLGRAYFAYFKAAGDHMNCTNNRPYTEPLSSIVDYGLYGKIPCDLSTIHGLPIHDVKNRHFVYVFLILGLPAIAIYGLILLVRGATGRAAGEFTTAQYGLLLYMLFVIAYVCLVGNSFENSENNRFRFNTDAFSLVLLGLFLDRVVIRRWRRTKNALPTPPTGDRTTTAAAAGK
jgi:hypothetical protein